jgi:pyruvate dehydrogenase E1 component alpha subunit
MSIKKMLAEILGKKTGLLKGKGVGCFRWIDQEIGLMGQSGMLGGNQLMAMGVGISIQLRKSDQVSVGFFGDGAANRGPMYEALNMASVWKLPVIFFCENNRYAWSMPVTRGYAVENIAERAAGFGMPGVTVDGIDPIAVYGATLTAVERARKGEGPTLLEGKVYRWEGHMITDPDDYRTDKQREEARINDPIVIFKKKLLEKTIITEEEDKKLREEAQNEIEEAVRFAEESPYPEPARAFEDLWA